MSDKDREIEALKAQRAAYEFERSKADAFFDSARKEEEIGVSLLKEFNKYALFGAFSLAAYVVATKKDVSDLWWSLSVIFSFLASCLCVISSYTWFLYHDRRVFRNANQGGRGYALLHFKKTEADAYTISISAALNLEERYKVVSIFLTFAASGFLFISIVFFSVYIKLWEPFSIPCLPFN